CNMLLVVIVSIVHDLSLLTIWFKLLYNRRQIVQNDLPRLCGSWVSAFFLVSLLVGFRNPSVKRIRYFLVLCLPVLTIAQALGHTHLSEDSPEINSENLLVILAPMVLVYGVSLFFLLLDQMNFEVPGVRYLIIFFFSLLAS